MINKLNQDAMSTTRSGGKKPGDEAADVELQIPADPMAVSGATAAPKPSTGPVTPTATKAGKAPKKPKYPCGKCDLDVNCGVVCNSCDIWFHDKCVEGVL